jgi:GT2 family glycosyltransferase
VAPDEVLIADDGSSEDLRNAAETVATELPFPVTHVWQPDEDYRLARSRNNAISAASGDVIAFLDQDTLPHSTWLATYVKHISEGRVCTGYVLQIPEGLRDNISTETVLSGEFESWHEPSEFKKLDQLQRKFEFYALMRGLGLGIRGRPAIAFGNACAMKSDLLKINGFDEEYIGWGQEDDDCGWRLYMAKVKPVPLVNSALVSHIPHETRRAADWKAGANIVRYRADRTSCRCAQGLDSHPHADVVVTRFGCAS